MMEAKEVNYMEEKTIVQQILKALDLHSDHIRRQMQDMEERLSTKIQETEDRLRAEMQDMENRLRAEMQDMEDRLRSEMRETEDRLRQEIQQSEKRLRQEMYDLEERADKRFERIETKIGCLRLEWSETQETVDFLARKTLQHEQKLRVWAEKS